jgi:TRAP-type C4-dicarboxylate transport system substrate-binding protein
VFPNSQLGGVGEMVDGIKSGAIAMGHPTTFASLGKIPARRLPPFNTPFVYTMPLKAMRATDPRTSVVLQDVNKQLIDAGGMRNRRQPLSGCAPAHLEGKSTFARRHEGQEVSWRADQAVVVMLTGMGAVATPVEVSELATALATGLVIGQENPLANIWTLKLFEVQKYVMMTSPHAVGAECVR